MRTFWQDLRIAWRSLRRSPGFVAVAVVSLGVGIGAVTTAYNWTDRFLLNPLPLVPETDRLVMLETKAPGGGTWSVSYPSYRDWAERNRVFEAMTVSSPEQVGVRFDEGIDATFALLTTDNYFDLFRVRALHGRTFQPGEGHRAAQVAVLGYDYWERSFKADPGVVGSSLVVNGAGYEVVGVLPRRFGGNYVGLNFDLYLLVDTYPALFGNSPLEARGDHFLEGFARIKPGLSRVAVQADAERIGRELDQLHPDDANTPLVMSVLDQGPPAVMRPVFIALLAVTGLVLLIACANVANLLLARSASRARELGVRRALGAGRSRLVRQLLTESAVLAVAGGLLGIWLAYLGRNALMSLVPPSPFPFGMDFPINGRVIGVAIGVATLAVMVFGLWPALKASRPDLVTVLKDATTGTKKRSRARTALVASQVALALVSLVAAGLFLQAIRQSLRVELGFQAPDRVLLVDTDLSVAGLDESEGPEVIDQLLQRLRSIPGVERASASSFIPLGWSCCRSSTATIDGYVPKKDENMSVVYALVTSDHFETMDIPVVAGRSFTALDRQGGDVAVVNEAFVRRYWPGQEALGRTFRQQGRSFTVVGVAKDGLYRTLTDPAFPLVYRPLGQGLVSGLTLAFRTAGDPKALIETLRREARAERPDLPFLAARTMTEQMEQATIGQQIGSRALAVFGLLALLLSAVGVYSVMAYAVSQRTREIGVRVALGASRSEIARMVIRQGVTIAGVGVFAGTVLAVFAGRLMEAILLGVSPVDPVTFGSVIGLLFVVALLASVVPATRAAAVDPVRAFRAE